MNPFGRRSPSGDEGHQGFDDPQVREILRFFGADGAFTDARTGRGGWWRDPALCRRFGDDDIKVSITVDVRSRWIEPDRRN